MSDHLIAEANRHAKALRKMSLPTTQPTQRDIQWYIEECIDLRKQLDLECASKREHLRIACDEINKLKVQVGIYERENAALRAELAPLRETVGIAATAATCADDLSNWSKLVERADNATRLERENATLNETTKKHVAAYYELLAENAALREDKARMDHLACGFDFPKLHDGKWHCFAGEFFTLREAIDAERKEAQP